MSDKSIMDTSNGMTKAFSFTAHHTLPVRSHPVLDAYISELIPRLSGNVHSDYHLHEEALRLPLDPDILAQVKKMAKHFATSRLKYVIVIGIGGSNLGTKAVYDALNGSYDLALPRLPKLLFIDTLSGNTIAELNDILAPVEHAQDMLINLISKSGTTVESIANFELIYQMLEKRFPNIASRVVCTTDRGSALWEIGEQRGFGLLQIPAIVGGRYSVFSAVGVFPLFLAGVGMEEFQKGASHMLQSAFSEDREKNFARNSAEELFAAMNEGCSMLNIFHFNPELESLGKWERQLIAESLGKEKDLDGRVVHAGITPIVSIGSTDLHSMAQLYLGGPKDKFTMLIRAEEKTGERITAKGILSPLGVEMAGKGPSEIMEGIYGGVLATYKEHGLPSLEVRLPPVSPYVLGAYMEWRMAVVLYLAKLMNVDPFDQPNVEDYKKVTRAILTKN